MRRQPDRVSPDDRTDASLGEFPVHNMETFNFVVEATPQGEEEPLTVKFLKQFYTE